MLFPCQLIFSYYQHDLEYNLEHVRIIGWDKYGCWWMFKIAYFWRAQSFQHNIGTQLGLGVLLPQK